MTLIAQPVLGVFFDAVRMKYRKGTYSVTIVTSVPWDMRSRALQVHSGRVRDVFCFFLQIGLRSGSDRTRAHLASRLLLCPNTRTPHMYCMKYCHNNYIINIIHRLCNRQVRNAYMHTLAYGWQLTMQSIREKLEHGELLKVPNTSGKAAFWQSFVCIDISGHYCRWW